MNNFYICLYFSISILLIFALNYNCKEKLFSLKRSQRIVLRLLILVLWPIVIPITGFIIIWDEVLG